jgi:uncharacterized membrane protein YkoI
VAAIRAALEEDDHMKLHLTRRALAVVGAVAVLAGGGATVAAASASTPATSTADGEGADGQDGGPGSDQEQQDPTFTGSITAPAGTGQADAQEGSGDDAQEQAALKALATVTPAEAQDVARTAVAGTVGEADLGNGNGFVVYTVEVTAADGTVTEVTVDAGNSAVLAQQVQDPGDPADGPDRAGDQKD